MRATRGPNGNTKHVHITNHLHDTSDNVGAAITANTHTA